MVKCSAWVVPTTIHGPRSAPTACVWPGALDEVVCLGSGKAVSSVASASATAHAAMMAAFDARHSGMTSREVVQKAIAAEAETASMFEAAQREMERVRDGMARFHLIPPVRAKFGMLGCSPRHRTVCCFAGGKFACYKVNNGFGDHKA